MSVEGVIGGCTEGTHDHYYDMTVFPSTWHCIPKRAAAPCDCGNLDHVDMFVCPDEDLPCQLTPPCEHGVLLHDIEDLGPGCCIDGCECGKEKITV